MKARAETNRFSHYWFSGFSITITTSQSPRSRLEIFYPDERHHHFESNAFVFDPLHLLTLFSFPFIFSVLFLLFSGVLGSVLEHRRREALQSQGEGASSTTQSPKVELARPLDVRRQWSRPPTPSSSIYMWLISVSWFHKILHRSGAAPARLSLVGSSSDLSACHPPPRPPPPPVS